VSRLFGFDCTEFPRAKLERFKIAARILRARESLSDAYSSTISSEDFYRRHLFAYGDEKAAQDAEADLMMWRMKNKMDPKTGELSSESSG